MDKVGLARGHILVVDDNKINLMMLTRALTTQGYQVTTAEDGSQALKILNSEQAETIDVVLLDILMPDLDGYQLLEQIKGNEELRHIPVIMISALDEMDSVIRCIEMGATDYLHKPYNPALLAARLNASMVEKRLRDLELEYLEQVGHVVKAAESVETSTYDPESLKEVAIRGDALGQLARVFQSMANEVHLREQRLKQQLEQLRVDVEDMRKSQSEPLSVYIPMDRRQALVHGKQLADQANGAALFADISGFTPLSEELAKELGHKRGAEELTRTLNQVYGNLIEHVHQFHGSVVGFSGDAITCFFDEDNGMHALSCALGMQRAMKQYGMVSTPHGKQVELAIKVAVVKGPVRRFLVGDPQIQNIEVLAGKTLDVLALGEHLANPGEVLVHENILDHSGIKISVLETREELETGQKFVVVDSLTDPLDPEPWIELRKDVLTDEQCRPWLLPAVFDQAISEAKGFMAEFRQAAALFLSFTGIDYDNDQLAEEKLDGFTRWVQSIVAQFEGSILQLTMGDKGSYLYAAFGAPVAHNDDAIRAVYAALSLREVPPEFEWIDELKIGVSQGQMRTGAYGSPSRRTYGAQGEKVNLAARLMQSAGEGILCDETVYQATQVRLEYETLSPIKVKGVKEEVPVFRPTGEKKRLTRKKAGLIGRTSERISLGNSLREIKGGTSRVVLVEGEPGIGKSRLVELVQEFAKADQIEQYLVDGNSGNSNMPFKSWRGIVWQLYDLDSLETDEARADRLSSVLEKSQINQNNGHVVDFIVRRDPGDIRHQYRVEDEEADTAFEVLLELVNERIQDSPMVLIFENAQIMDERSWEMVTRVSSNNGKLLIVIATRPLTEPIPFGYSQLQRSPNLIKLPLMALTSEETYLLACDHLESVSLPDELAQVLGKAGGNPRFIEEMVYILRDDGYVYADENGLEVLPSVDLDSIIFPTTADGLVKSRLDRLSPSEQLTLKVASVVGERFSKKTLQEIYPIENDKVYLEKHLENLAKLDLITPTAGDGAYKFRNEVTFESVYNSLLFSQRRQLHRQIAKYLEVRNSANLAPYYAELADHWQKADDTAKAIDYLEKAGQLALQMGDYEEAERYFKACLELDATAAVLSTEFFENKLKREGAKRS